MKIGRLTALSLLILPLTTFAASTENAAPTTQTAPSPSSSELFHPPRPPIPPGPDVKPQLNSNSENNVVAPAVQKHHYPEPQSKEQ